MMKKKLLRGAEKDKKFSEIFNLYSHHYGYFSLIMIFRPHEEGKSPAPVRRATSQENKQPIAAKRSSMKKPQQPPPSPPTEEQNGEEPTPKPRPHARKGGSGNHPPIPPNKPSVPPLNCMPSPAVQRKEEVTSFSGSPEPLTPPTPEPRKSTNASSFKVGDDEITQTVHVTQL